MTAPNPFLEFFAGIANGIGMAGGISIAGGLGIAFSAFIFAWQNRLETDKFRSELRSEVTELMLKARNIFDRLENIMPEIERRQRIELYPGETSVEKKILDYIDSVRITKRENLLETRIVTLSDFGKIWRILFKELSEVPREILRDVTFSDHGGVSLEEYDFPKYPEIVGDYLDDFHSNGIEVRFLIVCSSNGDDNGNKLSEKYLRDLLEIKYPYLTTAQALLDEWQSDSSGERPLVFIRLTNESVLEVMEEEKKSEGFVRFYHPFNVYGNLAMSESFVRGAETKKVLPYLKVFTNPNQDYVLTSRKSFDLVWNASGEFHCQVLARMNTDQKRSLGEGLLMREWSRLSMASLDP